jgi:hypothetical protein
MVCTDCDTPLDDVPVGAVCPGCAGYRRSASVVAVVAAASAMAAVPTVSTKRRDPPPWTEKWLTALHWLGLLRTAYSEPQLGNAEAQRRAETFFDECNHLRYWLKEDIGGLARVTPSDISRHFKNSPDLQWCRDIGDTYKHHTRDHGPTARIEETVISPTGCRVSVRVDVANSSASPVDALALAERCVNSWRAFFKTFGITPPA